MAKEASPTPQPAPPLRVSPPEIVIPPQPKSNLWKILFLALLGLLLLGGAVAAGYWYATGRFEKAEEKPPLEEATPSSVPVSKPEVPSPTPVEEPELRPASETVSVDSEWNRYINRRLGFSIKIPKETDHYYGSCYWNEEDEDHSYRPENAKVPVKVFEDGDDIYISTEYYYELKDETREDGRSYYADCDRVENSLFYIKSPNNYMEAHWQIVVREVANNAELQNFLQNRYGAGCSLGGTTASSQPGVFDVEILGDGLPLEETECPLNFMTVVKYAPERGRVVAWNRGQAYTFWKSIEDNEPDDDEMTESFRFE